MTSPFLVDNILHQQKTVNFHNQYLNQQIENYMLQQQRQNCQNFERSRENSPEMDDSKMVDGEDDRQEAVTEAKLEQDEDSKSRDEDEGYNNVKSEAYYNDYYRENAEKEILSIPNLNRRCTSCGAFDCPPFSCKKSGIRRLEELEKRFNFNYQENSGDEGEMTKEKAFTDDIVRNCDEFSEQKKPLLKFSVSAILGDREDGGRNSNINVEPPNLPERMLVPCFRKHAKPSVSIAIAERSKLTMSDI
ncbi:hypothetical protein NE865_10206 [Phthorimaea operculella]|nr:hypothetical protein NE865_10206 [Phthorimaea operculella]